MHRTMRRVLLLALSAAMLPAGSAVAATGHTYAGQFGAPSGDAGQLVSPAGIAVSPSGSTVYVADQGTSAVQAFDPSGDPGLRFDGAATPSGSLLPTGVAATAGAVWVGDAGSGVVDRFDTSGTYEAQITGADTPAGLFGWVAGVAVDDTALPTSGYVYVADSGNAVVDVFDASGAYVRQITGTDSTSFGSPSSVAVDGDGNVYVVDAGNNLVAEFAPGGTSFTRIVDQGRSPQAVAADPATGTVYVGNSSPDGYLVAEHHTDGTASDFGLGRIGVAPALAASPTSHAVFTADQGNGVVERFRTTTLPDAVTDAATAVTETTAQLNGTIDPLGFDTNYRFEYGLDLSYGTPVGENYLGSPAGGQPVAGMATDLQPNTTYHFRVVAMVAPGNEYGADETFTTPAVGPSLGQQKAVSISQTSATLVAEINPNNTATAYHFDLGTDASYGLGSVPSTGGSAGSGYGLQEASVDLASEGITLTPDTTYHFRVVADNGVGGPVAGPDWTFRTLPLPPSVVTGAATDVSSHGATLSGTVNPGGSGPGSATTYRFQYGTNTSYDNGGYAPAVPANGGSGAGAVPHTVAVGGLVPSTTYHYRLVATNVAGTVEGADKTFTTPAAPPIVTSGGATGVTLTDATLTATVDARGLPTSWVLELGTSTSYGMRSFGDAGADDGTHAVAVPVGNLAPGTTYHYRLVATNPDGTTASADATFTTLGFSVDLAPPVTVLTPAPAGPGRDLSPTPPAPKKPAVKKPVKHKKKSAKHKHQRTSTKHRKGKKS